MDMNNMKKLDISKYILADEDFTLENVNQKFALLEQELRSQNCYDSAEISKIVANLVLGRDGSRVPDFYYEIQYPRQIAPYVNDVVIDFEPDFIPDSFCWDKMTEILELSEEKE